MFTTTAEGFAQLRVQQRIAYVPAAGAAVIDDVDGATALRRRKNIGGHVAGNPHSGGADGACALGQRAPLAIHQRDPLRRPPAGSPREIAAAPLALRSRRAQTSDIDPLTS
jgi:hypothetical protein